MAVMAVMFWVVCNTRRPVEVARLLECPAVAVSLAFQILEGSGEPGESQKLPILI